MCEWYAAGGDLPQELQRLLHPVKILNQNANALPLGNGESEATSTKPPKDVGPKIPACSSDITLRIWRCLMKDPTLWKTYDKIRAESATTIIVNGNSVEQSISRDKIAEALRELEGFSLIERNKIGAPRVSERYRLSDAG